MIRTGLFFLLFQLILFQSFAQKLKERELTDYEWVCLNSNLRESDLAGKDTLVLYRILENASDVDTEYEIEEPNTSSCFNFVFSDSGFVTVYAADLKNAAKKRSPLEVDSLLFEQLKADTLLGSQQFLDLVPKLISFELWEQGAIANASNPKELFYIQLKPDGFHRLEARNRYVVYDGQLNGTTWKLDSKRQEISFILPGEGYFAIVYRIGRIAEDKIMLIQSAIRID
jgi:hypothetical protein